MYHRLTKEDRRWVGPFRKRQKGKVMKAEAEVEETVAPTTETVKQMVERQTALAKIADIKKRYAYYVERWIGFEDFECSDAYERMSLDEFLASNANDLGFGCYYDHWWKFVPESHGLTVKQYLDGQHDDEQRRIREADDFVASPEIVALKLNPYDQREVWESINRGVPPEHAIAQIKGRVLLPAHVLEEAYLKWVKAEAEMPF